MMRTRSARSKALALWLMVALAASAVQAEPTYADSASATATESANSVDDFLDDELEALFDEEEELPDSEGFPDPLERANRKVLLFNQVANKWLLAPISKGYAFLVPDPVRFAFRRLFYNANAPVTFVNDGLQLEFKDALMTLGSFLVNTTIGLGGLFEPGEKLGLPRHTSDFGQTMALARVKSGPYIVMPVMGPTNLRDGTGKIVDLFMKPASWVLGFGTISILTGTSEGIVTLETHQRDLEELERSSVDFYPVLRSAYYQNRMGEIWDRREHRRPEEE